MGGGGGLHKCDFDFTSLFDVAEHNVSRNAKMEVKCLMKRIHKKTLHVTSVVHKTFQVLPKISCWDVFYSASLYESLSLMLPCLTSENVITMSFFRDTLK